MKKTTMMKMTAAAMAAILFASMPVSAVEQTGLQMSSEQEQEVEENGAQMPDESVTDTEETDENAPETSDDTGTENPKDGEDETADGENADAPGEDSADPSDETEEENADTPEAEDGLEDEDADDAADEAADVPDEELNALDELTDIAWNIDNEGLLTVEGFGEIYDPESELEMYHKIPWLAETYRIKSAKVTLSGCTKLDYMFAGCYNLETVDLSGLDTSKVISMKSMFDGCDSLESIDMSGFQTSKVTNMEKMFYECWNLTALDLRSFDMSATTAVDGMLKYCDSLEKVVTPKNLKKEIQLPNNDEEKAWYLENGTETTKIPAGTKSQTICRKKRADNGTVNAAYGNFTWQFENGVLTVSGTGDVCDPAGSADVQAPWHDYADRIESAKIVLTNCTKPTYLFRGCVNLKTVDLSGLGTDQATDMSHMFEGCSKLSSVEFGDFDTRNVVTMECMFAGCSGLRELNLHSFDMTAVTNTDRMLDGCSRLQMIVTPKNVTHEIGLPLTGEAAVWYITDEETTEVIPVGTDSVTLYSKKELVPLPKDLAQYYAQKVGEDLSGVKQIKGNIWIAGFAEDSLVYTGSARTQDIRIYDKTKLLKKGTDYSLTYKNHTAARDKNAENAPCMTVKLNGQYVGSKAFTYSILQADINDATISGQDTALNYNKKAQEINPKVVYCKKTLKKGDDKNPKDYKVTYSGNTTGSDAGVSEITYTVEGQGNFKGTFTGKYYIVGSDYNLSKASVTCNTKVKYDGKSTTAELLTQLAIVVKIKGKEIDAENYEVKLKNFDKVGTGSIIIRPSEAGKKVYAGYCEKSYKLVGAFDFNKKTVTISDDGWQNKSYNKTICDGDGLQQDTDGKLTYGDIPLTEGTDYAVSYANNKKVGTAKVTFTGLGKYNGSITKTFKITAAEKLFVPVSPADAVYAKDGVVPEIAVTDADGVQLTMNTDYTLKLTNNKKVGQASYTITGKGNYSKKAVVKGTFNITAAPLADCHMTAPDMVHKNKKNTFKSTPVLYDRQNGKKLKAGTDYDTKTILYQKEENGVFVDIEQNEIPEAGIAVQVTVTGKGNYEGTCSTEYVIYDEAYDISKLYVKIDPQIYTGEEIRPELSYGDGKGSIHVYEKEDDMKNGVNELDAYEYVSVVSYAKNIKVGTSATVTLQGSGTYYGQKTYKFTILRRSIEPMGVSSVILSESCLMFDAPGGTGQLMADVLPVDADEWTVVWSSEDPAVATVNEKGFVEAVGSGITSVIATVTDTLGNKKIGSCRVLVGANIVEVQATINDEQDDTKAFETAINKAKSMGSNAVIWVPAGVYHIDVTSTRIRFNECNNVTMIMDDNAVLKALPTAKDTYYMIWIASSKNVTIMGGKIIGDRTVHKGSGGADGHCIAVIQSSDVTIDSMDISDGWGDGIYIGVSNYNNIDNYNNRITVKNCTVHNNRRNNIAVTYANGLDIINCTVSDHGTNDGFCIETNNDDVPVKNVNVENCTFKGKGKETMGLVRPAINVTFTNCTFNGDVYNGASQGGLVFDHCRITGDFTEVNHAKFPVFKYATLKETTIGGAHITFK